MQLKMAIKTKAAVQTSQKISRIKPSTNLLKSEAKAKTTYVCAVVVAVARPRKTRLC